MEATALEFEICYKDYYDRLYRVAYRIAGNREDAEDALQDAYLNAYRGLSSFRGQSTAGTWLYRITVNSALKYIKRRRSFPVSEMARLAGISEAAFFEQLADNETVEDTVLTENLREICLQMFLECMPRKQRVAFVLKVLLQLPGDQVADIMGITPGAVKTNVYRARQHMVNNMEGRCSLIKAGNPCSCGLWAAYALKTDKDRYFHHGSPVRNPQLDYKTLFKSEMNFLAKLTALYDATPDGCSSMEFIDRMQHMIAGGNLKLL